jgi:hypothetical protein
MSSNLSAYCQGFAATGEDWPPLPLADEPELAWWQQLIGGAADGALAGRPLLSLLEAALPQLQLPQVEGISGSELYKSSVLRGEPTDEKAIAIQGPAPHWDYPEALSLWISPHPCGAMPVLETPIWSDFVKLVRALAHRGEPVSLADGVHAQAISGLIHWGLIQQFGRQSRARLIVLHQAPYGSVPAKHVPGGVNDATWLRASTKLRLEHELTHLATQRLLGEMRLNLLDELVADCMGMVAALGYFSAELFGRCLGIEVDNDDQPIADGRWLSYTKTLTPDEARQAIQLVMQRARELENVMTQQPELLRPDYLMQRLRWLCEQKLDAPIAPLTTSSKTPG